MLGLIHFSHGLSSFCILCREPDHWDWLTREAEVLEYLTFVWQLVGVFEVGLSLILMIVAATGFRTGERWAWYLLWLWLPVLAGEAIIMSFFWPMWVVLIVCVLIVLWATRPEGSLMKPRILS